MATSVEAFKFMFEAKKMQELLDTKPGKVVCVVSIEGATTTAGKKVGALKIIARGPHKAGAKEGARELQKTFTIEGCPQPPCRPDE